MLTPRHRLLVPFILGLSLACRSQPAAPPPAPAPVISPDVWASVNGQQIRRDEVEKAYRRAAPPNQTLSEDETLTAKLNALDQMITESILLAKARELKIEVPDSEVDAAVAAAKKDIPEEAVTKELTARNLTPADMRDGFRRDLTARKLIEHEVSSKIVVSDQDINDFFTANKAAFNLKEDAVHLVQIVVTPVKDQGLNNRSGDDASTPEAASAKAQMLMERLKSGANFAELAMDFSEDPQSTPQGGDVGLVPVSALRQVPPQLRDVVMKSQVGAVNVVPMGGGFTIVAVVAKQAAGQRDPSMPEVRNGITATLRERREALLRLAYIEATRNQATVVNYLAKQIVETQGKLAATPAPAAAK